MTPQPILMQIILTVLALLGIERIVHRLRARAMGVGLMILWLCGTAVFLLFVWRPELSTQISHALGIGRGVDAAMYISVALLFYTILRIFLRLEKQENIITKLVSEIALLKNDRE